MRARRKERTTFEDALSQSVSTFRRPLIIGALLAFVVFIVVALAFVWRQYDDGKDTAAHDLRARAVLAATVFDTYFQGQLQTLSAVASSPPVVSGDTAAMQTYFAKFRPGSRSVFTAGIGWIDRTGHQRATSDPTGPAPISLAQRTYFRETLKTGKPVVADAVIGQTTKRRILVTAIPTHDARGRVSGVLAGGIVLAPAGNNARANDLGYAGLHVIDASGQQLTRRDLGHAPNAPLVSRLQKGKEGVLVDVDGLDGSSGHVVAFATAVAPKWTTVLDQPANVVFADARRALLREVLLLAAASLLVLLFLAWAVRRSRRSGAESGAQVARWAHLTRALNEAADAREVGDVLVAALAAEHPDGISVVVSGSGGGDGSLTPVAIARGIRAPARDVDDGVPVSISRVAARDHGVVALATPEDLRVKLGRDPSWVGSAYGVTLTRDRARGVAAVILFARERALDANELALLGAYADQAEQALGRVRRHQDEHDVAVLLQQSLLPDRLPETPGLEVGAHYRAGAPNTKIGGDWYDVVRRPDGLVHMTVGDVAGRGIDAAISMGQLRNAFRAYALEHTSPAAIIDRLARHVADDEMATTVCVAYDPCRRELTYAGAGHPPPLLHDPETGDVTQLEASQRSPLGWPSTAALHDERMTVSADARLALYTDGLVERRGAGIDEGIERLAAALTASGEETAEAAVESIVARVVPNPEDDVALLLVTFAAVPATLALEIPAEPRAVRELRRRIQAWLGQHGVEEATRYAAVLALNEACANVVEHAYRDIDAGTISVELTLREQVLAVVVEDRGSWREPIHDPERGRGILLMRNLMRGADIQHRRKGTRVVLETPV